MKAKISAKARKDIASWVSHLCVGEMFLRGDAYAIERPTAEDMERGRRYIRESYRALFADYGIELPGARTYNKGTEWELPEA